MTAAGLLAGAVLPAPARAAAPARGAALTVCVYHDEGERPGEGRLHAIMLENLLGHFREVRTAVRPVAEYRPGELSRCARAAYVGTRYEAPLPPAFLADVARDRRPFLWLAYNIESLQAAMGVESFARKTGFYFYRWRGFDGDRRPGVVPGFFRFFDYKGARFSKSAFVRKDGSLVAAPDIALLGAVDARVLATAVHSSGKERTPYVLEKGGFYYVADNPFLFIHERDRYLIAADLLFDFLGLPPRERGRPALVRLEDVHPGYDLHALYKVVRLLKRKDVPFAISVIPEYVRPGAAQERGLTLDRRRAFLRALAYAQANGGELLLHGFTHDVVGLEGCPSLGTGADYEFWDRCRQRPLPQDSASWARRRVARAKALLAASGLAAVAWVTPHYAASGADFAVFAKAFDRTVARVTYAAAPKPERDGSYLFVSQFFPYTIYRDHYGQFVWPENLGFVPMPGSDWGEQTPEDIATTLKVSSVVRDSWASFFWHPQLVRVPGELERLDALIDDIRSRGFRFVSLKERRARGE